MDIFVHVAVGWATTFLVSLSVRRSWPSQAKFLAAAVLAAGAAAATLLVSGTALSSAEFQSAFGLTFAAQQGIWHLDLDAMLTGGVSTKVHNSLLDVPMLPGQDPEAPPEE